MLRKLTVKLLAIAMLLVLTTSDLMAQTRVRFARGRNSATVSGTIGPGQMRTYVLRAMAGQSVIATVSSGNGKVDFTDRNIHDTQYSETTERNGDIYIRIDNHGRSTRYTLTISIQ
jgi:hypothetical protein